MKRGFTLIEMLAVIIIIGLISTLVAPAVINQISNSRKEVSDVTKSMIFSSAELYMTSHENDYPKLSGNTYCIKLEVIASQGNLSTPIKDYASGKEIPLTKVVKTKVNNYNEYDNFELKDNC